MLSLNLDHQSNLQFLSAQSMQVLQDFCKLAMDYLEHGPNYKLNTAAAQKLKVEPEEIQRFIEGIIYLLMECSKHRLNFESFQELLITLGFDVEKGKLLSKLYQTKQTSINAALFNVGLSLPQYHNMEWRFETQIASRSMFQQLVPLIILDFTLKGTKESKNFQHIVIQSDVTNLLHLTQELEAAMQEGRNQQILKIKRSIK